MAELVILTRNAAANAFLCNIIHYMTDHLTVGFELSFLPATYSLQSADDVLLMFTVGADIIMQLDDVVHSSVTGPRLEEATFRFTVESCHARV